MTTSADDDAMEPDDEIVAALVSELQAVADEVGQPPTKSEFDSHSSHNPQTYVSEFGSWVKSLRAAGLDPSEAQGGRRRVSEDELVEELERLADDLGRAPQVSDMNSRGKYSANTYKKRFGSWNAALEAVGLEASTVNEVSKEELLAELCRLADEIGHPPRTEHMDRDGKYSSSTYQSRFGGWQEALSEAGFEPFRGISEEELITSVSTLAEALGRPPTTTEFNEETPHSATTCKEKFGSWRETLLDAGLDPSENNRREYTNEELKEELQRLDGDLDHAPSTREMDDEGEYSAGVYQHRFGSWDEALDAADIDAETVGKHQYTKAELIEEMQQVADEVGHAPRATDMEQLGEVSPTTYVNRFGSWDDALEASDIDPRENASGKQYTDDELIDELRRLADEVGHSPTTVEMESEGEYSAGVYVNRFESWGDALETAGLDGSEAGSRNQYSVEELLDELRRLADEIGRPPTTTQMDEEGRYAYTTYVNRFGSWDDALEAAGVTKDEEN